MVNKPSSKFSAINKFKMAGKWATTYNAPQEGNRMHWAAQAARAAKPNNSAPNMFNATNMNKANVFNATNMKMNKPNMFNANNMKMNKANVFNANKMKMNNANSLSNTLKGHKKRTNVNDKMNKAMRNHLNKFHNGDVRAKDAKAATNKRSNTSGKASALNRNIQGPVKRLTVNQQLNKALAGRIRSMNRMRYRAQTAEANVRSNTLGKATANSRNPQGQQITVVRKPIDELRNKIKNLQRRGVRVRQTQVGVENSKNIVNGSMPDARIQVLLKRLKKL